jgi:predicted ATPase
MSSTSLSGTRSKTATGARNIALMREGLAAWLATGGYLFRPYYLGLLAEACGKAGQVEEGLRLLAEARAAAHQTGEHFFEPELHRLMGKLRLEEVRLDVSEVENSFVRALDVARRQQAKSLELRAAASLARLWGEQGRRGEARDLLAPVYG